ncbi:hypothetical protein ACFLTE_08505 [Bacteroidota bacterium]
MKNITIAGGVAANSGLRKAIIDESKIQNWKIHLPEFRYTTDNAAMIAITGYYKYLKKQFSNLDVSPKARLKI